jgi:hypothetical protein
MNCSNAFLSVTRELARIHAREDRQRKGESSRRRFDCVRARRRRLQMAEICRDLKRISDGLVRPIKLCFFLVTAFCLVRPNCPINDLFYQSHRTTNDDDSRVSTLVVRLTGSHLIRFATHRSNQRSAFKSLVLTARTRELFLSMSWPLFLVDHWLI